MTAWTVSGKDRPIAAVAWVVNAAHIAASWRTISASTSACLFGKYWYSEPTLTPATSATWFVVASS